MAWHHPEAAHEADALRVWDGDGAVRLRAADEFADTMVLLVERCTLGTSLARRPELEQDVVIAGLLCRLWRAPEPGHRFASLQSMCDARAGEFEERWTPDRSDLDPGLVRYGLALFRALPRTADRAVVLCTDLHADNVLAAQREPWLVIDPKPHVGDPTYDVVQHLLNGEDRLRIDPHGAVRRMADLAGLDRQRLQRWLFARCVQESPRLAHPCEVARLIAPT